MFAQWIDVTKVTSHKPSPGPLAPGARTASRVRRSVHGSGAVVLLAALLAACSGGGASTSGSGTNSSGNESSAQPSSSAPRRSGLSVHVQNVHAGGALPADADPPVDHLDVTFEMLLDHSGTEPLTGILVTRARLVADDGREVSFGVMSDGWDGRLEPGQHRTVAFHKTPDSAGPPARRSLCGQRMRLEVTLDLAGRQTTATSLRTQIDCPQMHAP